MAMFHCFLLCCVNYMVASFGWCAATLAVFLLLLDLLCILGQPFGCLCFALRGPNGVQYHCDANATC